MNDDDDTRPVNLAGLPTIREHAERKALAPWQLAALMARLSGEHIDGKRRFVDGVSLTTRMSVADFDGALDVTLHGRI
jgi:hypothetical protein